MGILTKVQEEMVQWQEHNFPNRPDWLPLMGAVEETGELVASIASDDVIDAIGDIAIYLMDYANSQNFDAESAMHKKHYAHEDIADTPTYEAIIQIHLGKMAHAHIKTFQGIRKNENHTQNSFDSLGVILRCLQGLCLLYETTLEDVLDKVWGKVKQRDWQANPDTAHMQG